MKWAKTQRQALMLALKASYPLAGGFFLHVLIFVLSPYFIPILLVLYHSSPFLVHIFAHTKA
jgi:hypothetical protein